jgi:NAD(P)-dependent dehydrogenase (short-subunit alcohol dehydrogenase family)
MTSVDDIKHLVATTAQELGGIDILINNAVNSVPGTFLELSDEAWLNHINVKIMGYVRCAREVIPHMRQRGGGRMSPPRRAQATRHQYRRQQHASGGDPRRQFIAIPLD